MARRHWNQVSDLGYSEAVTAYLACQMELELAMESLVNQLEEAGKAGRYRDRSLRRPLPLRPDR